MPAVEPRHSLERPFHAQTRVAHAPAHPGDTGGRDVGRDVDFMALLGAFRASGGLATGAEIAAREPGTGMSRLARWIVRREVLCLDWQGSLWLPAFQFERQGLVLKEAARRVASELPSTLDGWELADWWLSPNPLLAERSPLLTLPDDARAVAEAARVFRFLMAG